MFLSSGNGTLSKRQKDFLYFEHAANEIHGNHGCIHLSGSAPRAIREQFGSKPENLVEIFGSCRSGQNAPELWLYNDNPTTWGPSRCYIFLRTLYSAMF